MAFFLLISTLHSELSSFIVDSEYVGVSCEDVCRVGIVSDEL